MRGHQVNLTILLLLASGLVASAEIKPALPPLPAALKAPEARIYASMGLATLSISSEETLTDEQWEAIKSVPVKSYGFKGKCLDDAGMARLAALNPEALLLEHSIITDAGAAKFAEMKSLKILRMSHTDKLTPQSASALADHPSLEVFSNDGKFGIGGMAQIAQAKKLRNMTLQHGVAGDANIALLARHPALEILKLWPSGTAALTDAALPALATIPNLKDLTLELSLFTYAGGLSRLKELPKLATLNLKEVALSDEDLAKLKADLPNVTINFTPMKPDYRAKWDGWATQKK
jgi:hypothetical protein